MITTFILILGAKIWEELNINTSSLAMLAMFEGIVEILLFTKSNNNHSGFNY